MSPISPHPSNKSERQESQPIWEFRLYVAGKTQNSLIAVENIKKIGEQYFPPNYSIEVIDIFIEPRRALNDNIIVTPTLLRISPGPLVRIIGNLSDYRQVLYSLGIEDSSQE